MGIDQHWALIHDLLILILDHFIVYHPGLAEINAPVGSKEVVGHIFDSQLLIG